MTGSVSQRIVCLSAEAADWFWRLGAWDLVAGVTAYFTPAPEAPPKPRVSGFSSTNLTSILQFQPDLVLATNPRTLAEVETTLALLARTVDRKSEGEALLCEFRECLAPLAVPVRRPCVYFEEWNDPLITGIAWVSELIERAGGEDVFAGLRTQQTAPDRIVTSEQVRVADPEIMFASWCGKPMQLVAITSRLGWPELTAVRQGRVYEIPGEDILQPGFRLVYGYERIKHHL